jgi:ribonuclease E
VPAPAQVVEPTPVVSAEPVAGAASAPAEAASAVTELVQRPAAVEAAATPSPRANGLAAAELRPMLESAGLVWVNTDADKLRAAQEAAAQAPAPQRVVRERKPLPPIDPSPMQQVETRKDA